MHTHSSGWVECTIWWVVVKGLTLCPQNSHTLLSHVLRNATLSYMYHTLKYLILLFKIQVVLYKLGMYYFCAMYFVKLILWSCH